MQETATKRQNTQEWIMRNQKINVLTAVHRRLGEYCSSLETKSTASGGMRLWNIWQQGYE